MSFLGGGGDVKTPPPPAFAPRRADASVRQRGVLEQNKMVGVNQYIKTGPLGVQRKNKGKRSFIGGS